MSMHDRWLLAAALLGLGCGVAGARASGQVVGLLDDLPGVADLIEEIVGDATRIMRGLSTLVCPESAVLD